MEPKSAIARRVSLPSLIAWLSVCLLAAANGSALDAYWQVVWAEMGAFGLAAALGLGSVERVRRARQERACRRAKQTKFEIGLARVQQQSITIESINAAVRKLAQQAALDMRGKLGSTQRNRRRDQLALLADYPLQITPLEEDVEKGCTLPSQPGTLQQLSSRVVSFEHDEEIPKRTVLLAFITGDTRLSFVVDVTWTKKIEDVYLSGGTVLAVGVPDEKSQPLAATV